MTASDKRYEVRFVGLYCILILSIWLATHPYPGIIHDGRFYAVEAMRAAGLGRYDDDLYFRFGSQGQFTLSALYALGARWVGIGNAAIVLAWLGEALWLVGIAWLGARIFPDRRAAVIAVAAEIAFQGGAGLPYGEPFLTPRLFAEALTLMAIGAMLRRRMTFERDTSLRIGRNSSSPHDLRWCRHSFRP